MSAAMMGSAIFGFLCKRVEDVEVGLLLSYTYLLITILENDKVLHLLSILSRNRLE